MKCAGCGNKQSWPNLGYYSKHGEGWDSMVVVYSDSLQAGQLRVQSLVGKSDFLLSTTVQNGPVANQASYTSVPGLFTRGKVATAWHWLPTPSSAKVKDEQSCATTPPLCVHGILGGDLYLYPSNDLKRMRKTQDSFHQPRFVPGISQIQVRSKLLGCDIYRYGSIYV
jgi:hypothetical protein